MLQKTQKILLELYTRPTKIAIASLLLQRRTRVRDALAFETLLGDRTTGSVYIPILRSIRLGELIFADTVGVEVPVAR